MPGGLHQPSCSVDLLVNNVVVIYSVGNEILSHRSFSVIYLIFLFNGCLFSDFFIVEDFSLELLVHFFGNIEELLLKASASLICLSDFYPHSNLFIIQGLASESLSKNRWLLTNMLAG